MHYRYHIILYYHIDSTNDDTKQPCFFCFLCLHFSFIFNNILLSVQIFTKLNTAIGFLPFKGFTNKNGVTIIQMSCFIQNTTTNDVTDFQFLTWIHFNRKHYMYFRDRMLQTLHLLKFLFSLNELIIKFRKIFFHHFFKTFHTKYSQVTIVLKSIKTRNFQLKFNIIGTYHSSQLWLMNCHFEDMKSICT